MSFISLLVNSVNDNTNNSNNLFGCIINLQLSAKFLKLSHTL